MQEGFIYDSGSELVHFASEGDPLMSLSRSRLLGLSSIGLSLFCWINAFSKWSLFDVPAAALLGLLRLHWAGPAVCERVGVAHGKASLYRQRTRYRIRVGNFGFAPVILPYFL